MGMMIKPHLVQRILIGFGITFIGLTWLSLNGPSARGTEQRAFEIDRQSLEEQKPSQDQTLWHDLANTQNKTLGFGKIFVINLPSRTDKRDNISLGSSVTGLTVDFVDGVDPETVNPKTYPYNWNYDQSDTEYACRRAHVNVAQRIVAEGLDSAIIFEDDIDWDFGIKAQVQSLALATRALQGTPSNFTGSPYGHDWDVLWTGHCGMECKNEEPFFMTPNDMTVVMARHLPHYFFGVPDYDVSNRTRLTCTLRDAACTTSYGLSYRGAQKVLAALSVNPSGFADQVDTSVQIDVALGRMCLTGVLRCFGAFPSLTGRYVSAGLASKGTDQRKPDEIPQMKPAFSDGVIYSTMLNIKRILRGQRTVEATWSDVELHTILPEDIHIDGGECHPPIHPSKAAATPDLPLPDLNINLYSSIETGDVPSGTLSPHYEASSSSPVPIPWKR
ncbi:hypothetical protein N7462_008471 [Penicillium macrosclerotiorum]|uniref:uncharacterized protein n=1 Tax=Penicillium macrosclerotiorum TaxID=303699 RepID=UPI002546EB6F|nr:uncharacterized protein N7462_008471 [Penicillium macrosclerotiorum]KAJ5675574.1 hypothetical protein N7462_008471 [Penicillium macrosclerotiorum]